MLSVGLFVLLVAVVYGGGIELLGRPKPIRLEWQPPAEADVLGAHAVENQAIYVWLSLPDAPEPRAYVLPWSQKAAEQLQTAEQRASERGTGIKVRLTFGSGSDSDEGRFYVMPQPSLPPKNAQSAAIIYQRPVNGDSP